MDTVVCPKCKRHIQPIRLFDRSKRTGKPYLLIRCPVESCGYFLDIEDYTGAHGLPPNRKKSSVGDDGRDIWGDEL